MDCGRPGLKDPRLDAEVLLAEAMGWDRARLVADSGAGVPADAGRRFAEMVRRRLRREPVAYILGRKGFRHIELGVDRRVLIPRPETELLVELALELQPRRVLDVGTGSGAIALAVVDELPECEVVATDTSTDALKVARANAERLGSLERVRFVEGSVPEREHFDLILANLPYIAEPDWPSLQPEVTQWEPREALLAGPDGLDAIRAVLTSLARRVGGLWRYAGQTSNSAGALGLEVGVGQADTVAELLRRRRIRRNPAPTRPRRDRADRLGATVIPAEGARGALERCIADGGVAVFPADGLYGLACDPLNAEAIERIHRIKGRDDGKPSAVMYFSPLAMRELVETLGPRTREAAGALLPGPVTLVVANPTRRYPLACREDPERLGVRLIAGPLAGTMCPVFQTSANFSGEPAPCRLRRRSDGGHRSRRSRDRRRAADGPPLDGCGPHRL